MATKLLHIGLPKCGSTFLQKIIYPEIEKETNIKHYKKKILLMEWKNKYLIF